MRFLRVARIYRSRRRCSQQPSRNRDFRPGGGGHDVPPRYSSFTRGTAIDASQFPPLKSRQKEVSSRGHRDCVSEQTPADSFSFPRGDIHDGECISEERAWISSETAPRGRRRLFAEIIRVFRTCSCYVERRRKEKGRREGRNPDASSRAFMQIAKTSGQRGEEWGDHPR